MIKRYATTSFIYAIVAMVLGAFFREFTRYMKFTGITRLSLLHTHYFMLGMFFFLILLILEKLFQVSQQKNGKRFFIWYNVGLNTMGIAFFIKGFSQVINANGQVSKAFEASINGVSGIGHIFLGIGIILYFLALLKQIKEKE